MELKPGTRLRSQVDMTEVIVVRAPEGQVVLACGGHPMIDHKAEPEDGLRPTGDSSGGTQLGKRYSVAGEGALELLVTKPGSCAITVDDIPVVLKEARPLPASD